MARIPRFTVRKSISKGWFVEVPASVSDNGKRQRHFHKTRDAADAAAKVLREKHREHGAGAVIIKPSLAEAALAAMEMLEPYNISLLEAVAAHVATLKARAASLPMAEVWARYLQAKLKLREASLRGITGTRNRLTSLDDYTISEVAPEDVESNIAGPLPANGFPLSSSWHRSWPSTSARPQTAASKESCRRRS